MNLCFDTFPTPAGDFSVAVNETGAVVATAFGSESALRARLKKELLSLARDAGRIAAARAQVRDYFAGKRDNFDLARLPRFDRFSSNFRPKRLRKLLVHHERLLFGGV